MGAPLKGVSKRTNRVTLMVPKNVLEGVIALAQINDTSLNDYVCGLLEERVTINQKVIESYVQAKLRARVAMVGESNG